MNYIMCAVIFVCGISLLTTPGFAGQVKERTKVRTDSLQTESANAKLVDLNMAPLEQLMTLPGIGESEAKKIVESRPYFTKTELMKKKIIPEDSFYAIVDKVVIDLESFNKKKRQEALKSFQAVLNVKAKKIRSKSGLIYQDLQKGSGKSATQGDTVKVHYTGWLKDGTKFDSSRDRGEPLSFQLGKREVIQGWDEGIRSMKEGGKRLLTIPPKLGYGEGRSGKIPPNSTLIFEVELVGVSEQR